MPLGWYLAQGLIPLSEDSSDDDEGPCELPDGRVVCGPHGLVVCGKCCSDYSFMDDVLGHDSDDEDALNHDSDELDDDSDLPNKGFNIEDMLGPRLRRGTGEVFPTKFVPPNNSVKPMELFTARLSFMLVTRHVLPTGSGTRLIHTDGACLNNGQPDPRAGWAFSHGHDPSGKLLIASGRLEKKGPFGDDGLQTSNRAELRAIIAALRFRYWPGEGTTRLVIATDSEYAVEGSTRWAKKWVKDGWKKSIYRAGGRGGRGWEDVKNRDLWEALLGEIERYKEDGMVVQFWRIPRDWNHIVDAAAKEAAQAEDAPSQWTEMLGINL